MAERTIHLLTPKKKVQQYICSKLYYIYQYNSRAHKKNVLLLLLLLSIYIYIKPNPLKFPQFFTSAQYLNKLVFYLNKIIFV